MTSDARTSDTPTDDHQPVIRFLDVEEHRLGVIAGDEDPIARLSRQQAIAAAIPRCELQVLPHCGHMYFAKRPEEFATVLEDWLRRFGAN